jgi:hypothetical protein
MARPSRSKLSGIRSRETVELPVCLSVQVAPSPGSTFTAGTSDRNAFFARYGGAEPAQAYGTTRKEPTSPPGCDSLAATREHRRGIRGHLRISRTHELTRSVTISITFSRRQIVCTPASRSWPSRTTQKSNSREPGIRTLPRIGLQEGTEISLDFITMPDRNPEEIMSSWLWPFAFRSFRSLCPRARMKCPP